MRKSLVDLPAAPRFPLTHAFHRTSRLEIRSGRAHCSGMIDTARNESMQLLPRVKEPFPLPAPITWVPSSPAPATSLGPRRTVTPHETPIKRRGPEQQRGGEDEAFGHRDGGLHRRNANAERTTQKGKASQQLPRGWWRMDDERPRGPSEGQHAEGADCQRVAAAGHWEQTVHFDGLGWARTARHSCDNRDHIV